MLSLVGKTGKQTMKKQLFSVLIMVCLCTSLLQAEDIITIQPESPAQGQPFLVIIDSEKPLAWGEGQLFGLEIHLEPLSNRLVGMAGVPRNQKPGSYTVKLTVQYADGSSATLQRKLVVQDTVFDTQKLSVDPKYVSLSKEDLEWVKEDNQAASRAYASTANTRLWHKSFIKPAEGRWSAPFGVRRMFNGKERSYHSGADIAIPTGTQVFASNDGRVVLVKEMFFGGNTVIIDHGYGVFTGYMHLSEFKVAQGDLVEQGQLIGLSGSTGRVTGPHLHWMLRIANEKLDAAALLDLKVE
jgi:murein DD-endopeptidase MepM/ murein hydrolase activator NlpD